MSVKKSERECTASAIIAALLLKNPAMNLNIRSKRLPTAPIVVTLYISFSLLLAFIVKLFLDKDMKFRLNSLDLNLIFLIFVELIVLFVLWM